MIIMLIGIFGLTAMSLGLAKLCKGKPQVLDNGRQKKYFSSEELDYIGGIDGVYDLVKVYISMSNDSKLNITFYNKYDAYSRKVDFSNIIDMSIQTEEQVKNDVTLGRLIVFGVFALGMKKEKRYMEKYLIINYLENGQEQQIITRGQFAPRIKECYEKVRRNEVDYYTGQVRV